MKSKVACIGSCQVPTFPVSGICNGHFQNVTSASKSQLSIYSSARCAYLESKDDELISLVAICAAFVKTFQSIKNWIIMPFFREFSYFVVWYRLYAQGTKYGTSIRNSRPELQSPIHVFILERLHSIFEIDPSTAIVSYFPNSLILFFPSCILI